jgi:hypothetical protein
MSYDQFYLGWREEDTHGTSKITGAGDTAYLLGTTVENTPLPDPEWDYYAAPPDWGTRTTSNLVKTVPKVTTGAFVFCPHNALPLYLTLGDSATAATVHTLTAATQTAGIIPPLPSTTLHAERLDSGGVLTDWVTQYPGLRVLVGRFFCGDEHPELTCSMAWMGLTPAKQAFVLTSKPTDVPGTHTAPLHYLWPGSTYKYDGSTLEGVTYWEIAVNNNLHVIPGNYGAKYPSAVYQGRHQKVTLTVRYDPQVLTLHDDLLATTVPAGKNWEFEFVRDATDDKLKFTCTTAATVKHTVPHPNHAGDFMVELDAAVTSLTVTATDQIAAAFYGD